MGNNSVFIDLQKEEIMKLSSIKREKKKNQPQEINYNNTVSIIGVLEKAGISEDEMVSTAMELYIPHTGVENKDIAQQVFRPEFES